MAAMCQKRHRFFEPRQTPINNESIETKSAEKIASHIKLWYDVTVQKVEKIFNKLKVSPNIHEAVLYIENTKGDFSQSYGHGGRDINSPMIMASITKMFTTTCLLKLCEQKKLSLDDKINIDGLSSELTVSHLLFQTSGLPDYFSDKNSSIGWQSIIEQDREITLDESLAETKRLGPKFAPSNKKAFYSDINYELLGMILVKASGLALDALFKKFIFEPLGMSGTFLPGMDSVVPHSYYKDKKFARAKYMASCGAASGGCVSTPKDLMKFSKAFWGGQLFDKKWLGTIADYKRVFGPIYYGGGHMRFGVGWLTNFRARGYMVGHSGFTCSFMYYYPHKDLHFVGDLSQCQNPAASTRLLLKLAVAVR